MCTDLNVSSQIRRNSLRGVQQRPRSARPAVRCSRKYPTPAASACPPLGLWLVLQVRAQELVIQQQGLGGRAAGPSSLSWRPDIPSRRPARRETAGHSLQSDQGGAATASAPQVGSGLQRQCGPHSLSQRRADGEPEELPDTPLPNRGERPVLSRDPCPGGQTERATLGLGPPEYSGASLATGGE